MARAVWSAIPAERTSSVKLRRKVNVIIAALLAAAAAGVASTIGWMTFTAPVIPPPPPEIYGEGFADAIATQYLTGQPGSLPVAKGLDTASWAGNDLATIDQIHRLDVEAIDYGSEDIEIHTYLIDTDIARKLSITLQILPGGYPVLVTQPALEPIALSGADIAAFDWQQAGELRISEDVERTVVRWAEAYAADDRDALKQLSGDEQPGQWPGLGGMQAAGVKILGGGSNGKGDLVVQVSFKLATPEAVADAVEANPPQQPEGMPVSYDLLVARYNTAGPRIVAWGPAGSGGTLEPFENAIRGG